MANPSVMAGSKWSIPPRKCCIKAQGSRVSFPNRRYAKRIPFASTNCVGAVTCVGVIRSLLLRAGRRRPESRRRSAHSRGGRTVVVEAPGEAWGNDWLFHDVAPQLQGGCHENQAMNEPPLGRSSIRNLCLARLLNLRQSPSKIAEVSATL